MPRRSLTRLSRQESRRFADRARRVRETHAGGRGQRALQRWEPAPGEEALEELEAGSNFEPGWNQFELNEAKFGVQSTWDEVGEPHWRQPVPSTHVADPSSNRVLLRCRHCILGLNKSEMLHLSCRTHNMVALQTALHSVKDPLSRCPAEPVHDAAGRVDQQDQPERRGPHRGGDHGRRHHQPAPGRGARPRPRRQRGACQTLLPPRPASHLAILLFARRPWRAACQTCQTRQQRPAVVDCLLDKLCASEQMPDTVLLEWRFRDLAQCANAGDRGGQILFSRP